MHPPGNMHASTTTSYSNLLEQVHTQNYPTWINLAIQVAPNINTKDKPDPHPLTTTSTVTISSTTRAAYTFPMMNYVKPTMACQSDTPNTIALVSSTSTGQDLGSLWLPHLSVPNPSSTCPMAFLCPWLLLAMDHIVGLHPY